MGTTTSFVNICLNLVHLQRILKMSKGKTKFTLCVNIQDSNFSNVSNLLTLIFSISKGIEKYRVIFISVRREICKHTRPNWVKFYPVMCEASYRFLSKFYRIWLKMSIS